MNRSQRILLTSLGGVIAAATLLSGCTVSAAAGPTVAREYHWDSDRLVLDVPAHLHFHPAPTWHLVIRAPQSTLDRLEVGSDTIREHEHRLFGLFGFLSGSDLGNVQIELSGPALRAVRVNGSDTLELTGLQQNALRVRIEGSASLEGSGCVGNLSVQIDGAGHVRLEDIKATEARVGISGTGSVEGSGTADTLDLTIRGSGHVGLAKLALTSAQISISGSGSVDVAPTDSLSTHISGSGRVRLFSHPAHVTSQISGAGTVVEMAGATPSGTTASSP